MKALVIGGNGFIGSHLVDRLVQEGWHTVVLDAQSRRYNDIPDKVRFIQGDFSQSFILREALEGVEIVFHLAWASIHEIANREPVDDIQTNLISSVRLLELCKLMKTPRIVFLSSGGTVYGDVKQLPIVETYPQNPLTAYGITKLAVEKYLFMYWQLYGLESVILRPSTPYGPYQDPLRGQGAVTTFLYRISNGLPVTLWGDGQITRDFFYISDLVEALIATVSWPAGPENVFNIGGGVEISLRELLSLTEEITGKSAIVEYKPARAFDAPRICLDTQRAKRDLSWSPKVSLQEGMVQTRDWLQNLTP